MSRAEGVGGSAGGRVSRRRNVRADTLIHFAPYEPTTPAPSSPTQLPTPRRSVGTRPRTARRRATFIESNARFALNPDATDPTDGSSLNWADVDLVLVERPADASGECPICLESLSAAKITPCGHVFDHVCLLQHAAHSVDDVVLDDPSVNIKCPLCNHYFTLGSLKNVAFRTISPVVVGSLYSMRLVSATDFVAAPYAPDVAHELPKNVDNFDALFARFCYASRHFLQGMLVRMAAQLRQTLAEEPSLKRFVDVAAKDVKNAKQAVRRRNLPGCGHCATLQVGEKTKSPEKVRMFYQSSDASNVFLHPINHRCLMYEHDQDFTRAQTTLEARVLEVERHTMDEITRKRYRFLRHLPDGCEFTFVELDLGDVLEKSTTDYFKREIAARCAAREKKKVLGRREDERMHKQQTESLLNYFRIHDAHLRQRACVPADHNDETSFPALAAASPRPNPDNSSSGDTSPATGVSPSSASWGPAISSYSSVTSSMGLFPALGSNTSAANDVAHSPPRGAWANARTPSTPIRNNPTSPPITTPNTGRRQRRQGARANYTPLLSNAGAPHRR